MYPGRGDGAAAHGVPGPVVPSAAAAPLWAEPGNHQAARADAATLAQCQER